MVQTILAQLDALDAAARPDAPMRGRDDRTSSTTLNVELGERSYPIADRRRAVDTGLVARHVNGRQVAIVTNTTVAPLYLERVAAPLRAAGRK